MLIELHKIALGRIRARKLLQHREAAWQVLNSDADGKYIAGKALEALCVKAESVKWFKLIWGLNTFPNLALSLGYQFRNVSLRRLDRFTGEKRFHLCVIYHAANEHSPEKSLAESFICAVLAKALTVGKRNFAGSVVASN